MPTRYDKEFKQNIINLYKQGELAAQLARKNYGGLDNDSEYFNARMGKENYLSTCFT
jgi:hypothetical protein